MTFGFSSYSPLVLAFGAKLWRDSADYRVRTKHGEFEFYENRDEAGGDVEMSDFNKMVLLSFDEDTESILPARNAFNVFF